MTLTFNPLRATVMTYSHAKFEVNGQSVQWKQTEEQTDGGDCITSRANAVSKNAHLYITFILLAKFRLHVLKEYSRIGL